MNPKIQLIQGFLDRAQCEELISLARPRLTRSRVWSVEKGEEVEDDYRLSEQAFFGVQENKLIAKIEEKISRVTDTKIENGEGIQVVHYSPGGYYKAHFDYFDPQLETNKSVLDRGGQRVLTFMVYLNDVAEGGNTYFSKMGLRVEPKQGRAVCWTNVLPDGSVDAETEHIAEPVLQGEKWIFTKWVRERTFI